MTSDRLPSVDIILVDHKYRDKYAKISKKIEQLVSRGRPRIVIESYPIQVINQIHDFPLDKDTINSWIQLEYSTSGRYMSANEYNGQVKQDRVIICHLWREPVSSIRWPPSSIFNGRSMNNALRYTNIPSSIYCKTVKENIPKSHLDCMPSTPGSLIQTSLGVRRCLADEVAIAKGQPASELFWRSSLMPTGFNQAVQDCTAVVLWETALQSLYTASPTICEGGNEIIMDEYISQDSCWSWQPPSHDYTSNWYHNRVQNLSQAISLYSEDQGMIYKKGLEDLDRHFHNYDEQGPKPQHLQLLWWEFPSIHWDEVRLGSPCNFLYEPSSFKEVDQVFDEDQVTTVTQFIDELVNLGTLNKTSIEEIHCIAPLFCVPKPGQPGEWRVIADFKRGGQNSCIGADPCYLQRLEHIVEHLYTGGYTAVVDASKYFYQFKTCPDERKYMGLSHPKTGDVYHYCGLPMGSANSPAISSRLGYAFIRKVYDYAPHLFKGSWKQNTWATVDSHKMQTGHGLVLMTESGLPAVQIYAWIDDFMIHGPSLESTEAALTAFMEVAFNCGLLCHPAKLEKPSQEIKYCGLLINTVGTPQLCIPPRKRDRAINMIKYCLTRPNTISGLVIAVLTGVLESLVAITFSNLGRSYLRNLYNLLNVEATELFDPYARYYQDVKLNAGCRQDLNWWLSMLSDTEDVKMFATISPQVICLFGDGSGSGTGGMFVEQNSTPIAWMSTWNAVQQQQTSNWKELYTVLLSLLQVKQKPSLKQRYQNSTILYFTDNMVTYYVLYKGRSKDSRLQAVLHQIKKIEVELRLVLYAIHIPGKILIQQGTDGLSRGIWPTPYNSPTEQYKFALTLLQPVRSTREIIQWLRQRFNIFWVLRQCTEVSAENVLFQNSIFFPTPEIAQQLLCILLRYWVEKPYHTMFCVVLPRIMQASWSRISKHLMKEDIKLITIPQEARPDIFTDIILVYALTFSPSLPEFRMDPPPAPFSHRRHCQEAEELRGL